MLVQILMKQLESHGDKGIAEVVSLDEAQQKLKDALAKLMAGDEADFGECLRFFIIIELIPTRALIGRLAGGRAGWWAILHL